MDLVIRGSEYAYDGEFLIAERYDDGVVLRVTCTSDLSRPCTAQFVVVGPRGGVRTVGLDRLSIAGARDIALWMMDAKWHIEVVEAYRLERWGGADLLAQAAEEAAA